MPAAATIERRPRKRRRHRAPFRVETTEPAASAGLMGRLAVVAAGSSTSPPTVSRSGGALLVEATSCVTPVQALLRVMVASDSLTSMCSRFQPAS
jgi:hypothetical protein